MTLERDYSARGDTRDEKTVAFLGVMVDHSPYLRFKTAINRAPIDRSLLAGLLTLGLNRLSVGKLLCLFSARRTGPIS